MASNLDVTNLSSPEPAQYHVYGSRWYILFLFSAMCFHQVKYYFGNEKLHKSSVITIYRKRVLNLLNK